MFNEKTYVLYETRYCAQDDYSIAVCTKESVRKLELPLNINSYGVSKQLDIFMEKKYKCKIVASGTDLFLISKSRKHCTFEKYSESSKTNIVLPSMLDRRSYFCVCSFMQKIYVIGGEGENFYSSFASCMCYDIKSNKWTYIASMIVSRRNASCAVFKGKIVVTGGFCKEIFSHRELNCAESYCFHENKWTNFSNMLVKRCSHATVSIGNKLFVIGGNYENTCEVFDSNTNKFVFIKNTPGINYFVNALSIGYKIYVFQEHENGDDRNENRNNVLTLCYNDRQNAWIEESSLYFVSNVVSCAKMF